MIGPGRRTGRRQGGGPQACRGGTKTLDKKTEARFQAVFSAIRQVIDKRSPVSARRRIGFRPESEDE